MSDKSAFVAALVRAQADMGGAKRDSKNPHFKSTYADLESVTAAIKPIATEHGLAFIQKFHEFDGGVAVETIILHESGEQFSNGILRVPASKQDAQGYGSAITYARRYSLMAAFGLCPEDDDGNAATAAHKPAPAKPQVKPYAENHITPEQKGQVVDMAAEAGVPAEKVLEFCGCKTFETIPASKFDALMKKMADKLAEVKK